MACCRMMRLVRTNTAQPKIAMGRGKKRRSRGTCSRFCALQRKIAPVLGLEHTKLESCVVEPKCLDVCPGGREKVTTGISRPCLLLALLLLCRFVMWTPTWQARNMEMRVLEAFFFLWHASKWALQVVRTGRMEDRLIRSSWSSAPLVRTHCAARCVVPLSRRVLPRWRSKMKIRARGPYTQKRMLLLFDKSLGRLLARCSIGGGFVTSACGWGLTCHSLHGSDSLALRHMCVEPGRFFYFWPQWAECDASPHRVCLLTVAFLIGYGFFTRGIHRYAYPLFSGGGD